MLEHEVKYRLRTLTNFCYTGYSTIFHNEEHNDGVKTDAEGCLSETTSEIQTALKIEASNALK